MCDMVARWRGGAKAERECDPVISRLQGDGLQLFGSDKRPYLPVA
jgi:hypothetical protein